MTTEAIHRESEHPYLSGNFAPVHDEVTITDLKVIGSIPDYLDGRYLRVGPNPLRAPDPRHYHWFLGDGMAHGIRLRDGVATWYRNRWVRSASVARQLGERWAGGAHAGGFDFAANTNIIGHAGKTFALTEAGVRPYELSEELDTVGPSDFCGTLFGGFTAHPKHDPKTGELHAVSYNPLRGNLVSYTVTGVDGRVRRAVDIALPAHTMMHDFTLTEKYVVIYDLPVLLDLTMMVKSAPARTAARLLTGFAARHAAPDFVLRAAMRGSEHAGLPTTTMPYRWAPEHGARVGVLPRAGSATEIRWFEVPPCYVFHALNGYDRTGPDGEQVVLDVVRHPEVFTTGNQLFTDSITLDRWTIDLSTGRVDEQRLDGDAQEFPRVDDRVVGSEHRYGYTVGFAPGPDGPPAAILRHDLREHSTQRIEFGPGREPGEFVFVPAGPDAEENDGVLMGFVYDRAENRSDLVLLDGQSLAPVATVQIPVRVPHGFHGNWVASDR
ncbi:carotenoid cleavage dioxygenase [Mycobacterium frederiksbergense]|uniref:Dioxygenase n=1 Tax=Mycolicibacterium frederiksbergense TaxID=117567 RepID=A0ABT6L3Q0_9MYCO|nr:carotenoid oxygenase family protein [Mycolicibacterium frederiksbergense]MDH6197592.1 carotenoid cleavage dioxygenase [Mycolicibacterium frederiksbergense]